MDSKEAGEKLRVRNGKMKRIKRKMKQKYKNREQSSASPMVFNKLDLSLLQTACFFLCIRCCSFVRLFAAPFEFEKIIKKICFQFLLACYRYLIFSVVFLLIPIDGSALILITEQLSNKIYIIYLLLTCNFVTCRTQLLFLLVFVYFSCFYSYFNQFFLFPFSFSIIVTVKYLSITKFLNIGSNFLSNRIKRI